MVAGDIDPFNDENADDPEYGDGEDNNIKDRATGRNGSVGSTNHRQDSKINNEVG